MSSHEQPRSDAPGRRVRIGVDLGGTKTEIVVLAAAKTAAPTSELWRRRVPTPTEGAGAIADTIAQLVFDAERALDRAGSVGVCTPGAISPRTGLLRNSNTACLNGTPFRRMLEQRLGRAIAMDNDANCLAASEATDGAGAGATVVFAAILGTGVGGAIAIDRKILSGHNAIAGEWGHNPLPWSGPHDLPAPACYCGKRGCVESYLSGPALLRDYQRQGGQAVSATEVARRADAGEPIAVAALERYAQRLARALAAVINLLDPDVVVLGGGLSNVERLYATVPQLWQSYVFSDGVSTQLARAAHGDSSGARGAAWLAPDGAA